MKKVLSIIFIVFLCAGSLFSLFLGIVSMTIPGTAETPRGVYIGMGTFFLILTLGGTVLSFIVYKKMYRAAVRESSADGQQSQVNKKIEQTSKKGNNPPKLNNNSEEKEEFPKKCPAIAQNPPREELVEEPVEVVPTKITRTTPEIYVKKELSKQEELFEDSIETTIKQDKKLEKQTVTKVEKKTPRKPAKINLNKLVDDYPILEKKPGSLGWTLTVSFGKTTSKNLTNALYVAKKSDKFKVENIDGSEIYTVDFNDSREDINLFMMLYDIVGNWKSTAFFINGEMVRKSIISEVKWCYGDKCNSIKPDFCYGASGYTENPFGCHRLQISTYNTPWWNFYQKEGSSYILDKQAIVERIHRTYNTYKYCPAFDLEHIMSIADALPLSLTSTEYRKLKSTVEKHLGYTYF